MQPLDELLATAHFVILNRDPTQNRNLWGAYSKWRARLQAVNEAPICSDIFFTINETDSSGRRLGNLTAFRAVFADYDEGLPAAGFPEGAQPSYVVESSPERFQAYWILQRPFPAITPANLALWGGITKSLVTATGADTNACDAARIFRVPGFLNHKREEPFLVRVVEAAPERSYTLQQLAKVWPPLSGSSFDVDLSVLEDVATTSHGAALPPPEKRAARYTAWLQALTWPPSGRGQRNGFIYKAACAGLRDFALAVEQCADAIERVYDERYEDEYEIRKIVYSASRSARGVLGGAMLPTKSLLRVEMLEEEDAA